MDNLIDGKAVAAQVRAEVAERTKRLQDATGVQAGLAVIPRAGHMSNMEQPLAFNAALTAFLG